MKPRILLVNPPIYDFSAYDFWLKPYGMLRVAGFLRGQADFQLFDFLDRFDSRVPQGKYRSDQWGRGEFYAEVIEKPTVFAGIKRHFKRFGLRRGNVREISFSGSEFRLRAPTNRHDVLVSGRARGDGRHSRDLASDKNHSRRCVRHTVRDARPGLGS